MKRRCFNCKCIEEESPRQYSIRTKKDLKAKFYCKKCRKSSQRQSTFTKIAIPSESFSNMMTELFNEVLDEDLKDEYDEVKNVQRCCFNCKSIEEESSSQYYIIIKSGLNTDFLCKICKPKT